MPELNDAQLRAEIAKCDYCETKPCREACPAHCSPADFIMAAAVGDYAGPENAAKALGFITLIFGMGQISGPAIAGVLAQHSGSFSSSFYMAAALAGAAILLSAMLKKPQH